MLPLNLFALVEPYKFLGGEICVAIFGATVVEFRFQFPKPCFDFVLNALVHSGEDARGWHLEYRFICERDRQRRDARRLLVAGYLAWVPVAEQLSHLALT